MNKFLNALIFLMFTPVVYAENIEVITSDNDDIFSIDKDTIEKKGSYYQALIIHQLTTPSIVLNNKHDQYNLLIKYDCVNNAQFIVRMTTSYQGRQIADWFNPEQENFNDKNDSGVKLICRDYLIQDKNTEFVSEDNGISLFIDKNTIKKFGQYSQAKLILKSRNASVANNGSKFDQMNTWIKFDCKNNLQQFMRVTKYYQGIQIADTYAPTEENFEKSTTAKTICEKYLR